MTEHKVLIVGDDARAKMTLREALDKKMTEEEKDLEECWACPHYPENVQFKTEIRTHSAKTATEVDKWTFVTGLDYKFCPFCGRTFREKGDPK